MKNLSWGAGDKGRAAPGCGSRRTQNPQLQGLIFGWTSNFRRKLSLVPPRRVKGAGQGGRRAGPPLIKERVSGALHACWLGQAVTQSARVVEGGGGEGLLWPLETQRSRRGPCGDCLEALPELPALHDASLRVQEAPFWSAGVGSLRLLPRSLDPTDRLFQKAGRAW